MQANSSEEIVLCFVAARGEKPVKIRDLWRVIAAHAGGNTARSLYSPSPVDPDVQPMEFRADLASLAAEMSIATGPDGISATSFGRMISAVRQVPPEMESLRDAIVRL